VTEVGEAVATFQTRSAFLFRIKKCLFYTMKRVYWRLILSTHVCHLFWKSIFFL